MNPPQPPFSRKPHTTPKNRIIYFISSAKASDRRSETDETHGAQDGREGRVPAQEIEEFLGFIKMFVRDAPNGDVQRRVSPLFKLAHFACQGQM